MYNNFGAITITDTSVLPVPPNLVETVKKLRSDFEWEAYGVPYHGCVYELLGKDLYADVLPNGETKVQKLEFTGEMAVGSTLLVEEGDSHYFVVFTLKFLNGVLVEAILVKAEPMDKQMFSSQMDALTKKINKVTHRQNSWWFKYLYTPYCMCVRAVGIVLILALRGVAIIIDKVVNFLTPI